MNENELKQGTKATKAVSLMDLVGSGDKIGLFMLPFLVIGLGLNIIFPSWFRVGGPAEWLKILSIILLVPGVIVWLWSVVVILMEVPKGKLITKGPYAVVKHPLYTGVSLLVLPWLGFLLNSWLGAVLGLALYAASRLYAPAEEKKLADEFGSAWKAYSLSVLLPWL